MTNNEIIINQAIAHGIYTKAEAQAIVAAKGCFLYLSPGESPFSR